MHAQATDERGDIVDGEVVDTTGKSIATPVRTIDDSSPAGMIAYAMRTNASIADLRELYALKKEWEADEARKDFNIAMTAFKAQQLVILKRKRVGYGTKDGDFVGYSHAELSDITETVGPAMAPHELSFTWNVRQESGLVYVDCIVKHAKGHSETVTMFGSPDNSGKKNGIQQTASTVTYLQRYTLLAALGLATKGMDDDGRGGGAEPVEQAPEAEADRDARRRAVHDEAFGRHADSIAYIKEKLASGDLQDVANEWRLIPKEDQMALWLAPTKGGCFTTAERETMKSKLPKVSA